MLFRYYLAEHLIPDKKLHNLLIIVGTTVFIGVVWEFAEYLGNRLLSDPIYYYYHVRVYFMGDLQDTIKDLMDDTLGALFFTVFFYKFYKKSSGSGINITS